MTTYVILEKKSPFLGSSTLELFSFLSSHMHACWHVPNQGNFLFEKPPERLDLDHEAQPHPKRARVGPPAALPDRIMRLSPPRASVRGSNRRIASGPAADRISLHINLT
jgi:hypothetical protein